MRKLRIDWSDFEVGCEPGTSEARSYLDLEMGAVLVVFDETAEQLRALLADADPDTPVESLIAQSGEPDGQKEALREAWRVALIGSLTRDEPEPKDADILVRVSDGMDLTPLAKAGRKLSGHAQQLGRGADVFLANERGDYIGRTCHWRECGPFIRASCDAFHCGGRLYLHDDFRAVRLTAQLIAAPPVDLWPEVRARVPVPADVESVLLTPLRAPPEAKSSAAEPA